MRSPGLSGGQSVSACLLCYNDAETIGRLVDAAAGALDRLGAPGEIVVVNDGSTDESRERLRDAQQREPRLRVIEHEANRGYGGALRSALETAGGDWIFYTDGDGQYDPGQLVRLAELASPDVDVVQGYKHIRADSVGRRLAGTAYSVVARWGFGLRIRDPDCDFRLMRRSLLRTVELESDSGASPVELVWRLQDAGARFAEIEVSHYRRHAGRSQFFTPSSVSRTLADIVFLWIRLIATPAVRRLAARVRHRSA